MRLTKIVNWADNFHMTLRALWGFVDGEPYLIDSDMDLTWEGQWFFRTVVVNGDLVIENPPVPLRMDDIGDDDILRTEQVAYLAGCHPVTVLRHVTEGRLKVLESEKDIRHTSRRGKGHRYLGREVRNWIAKNHFRRGRPRKTDMRASPEHLS